MSSCWLYFINQVLLERIFSIFKIRRHFVVRLCYFLICEFSLANRQIEMIIIVSFGFLLRLVCITCMYTNHCNLTVTIYKGCWESNEHWVLVMRVEGGGSVTALVQTSTEDHLAPRCGSSKVSHSLPNFLSLSKTTAVIRTCCDKNPANCEAHAALRVFTPKPYAAVGIKLYMDQRFWVKELYILGFNHLKVDVHTCMIDIIDHWELNTPFFVNFKRTNPII